MMTPEPVTIDAGTSAEDALHLMGSVKIRHLPVVAGAKIVGMISDRDLRAFAGDEALAKRSVATVIDREVFSVAPSDSLQTVVDTMIENRVGALAVIDARENIVGIISYVDVLRAVRMSLA